MEAIFPIRAVTQQTGLSPHVLRIWERRYEAVTPHRSPTNRRLYSEKDIEKLRLLRRLTDRGHSIGQVAQLGLKELKALDRQSQGGILNRQETKAPLEPGTLNEKNFLTHTLAKIRELDAMGLEQLLDLATLELSPRALLEELLPRLLQEIGNLWERGKLGIAHEHVASTIIRTFLSNMRNAYPPRPGAPKAIFATPPGQDHDIGALLAAKVSAVEGWQPIFLGANVPVSELAETVKHSGARLIGLSVLPTEGTEYLEAEIKSLGKKLNGLCPWVLGGKGAQSLKPVAEGAGGKILDDLEDFRQLLRRMG